MTVTKGPDLWSSLSTKAPEAFEELKQRQTEAPDLAFPRREGANTVDTDVSAGHAVAVLLQKQPDRSTRSVGYWSRSPNAADWNYSTTERECLAVVWASLLLRPYVEGTRFTVRTDHKALKWMLHMNGAHGRLAWWRLRLSEFIYVVQTRPGASHHATDIMSRISTPAEDNAAIPDAAPCLAMPNSTVT